jgi:hypothetical protein
VVHLGQIRTWFGRPLWEMNPPDADGYFAVVLRDAAKGTRLSRAQALKTKDVCCTRGPATPATTENLAATSGRLTRLPRLHPDEPGQEPTATPLHEGALGRNQRKTTRKVGWRLEGNQRTTSPEVAVVKGSR